MPLKAPALDNRKFEDLVEEARFRIARYNSDWTDFNESDPGITLVQLFAWLTELMLYQFNQIPDRNYIKFLQLLGQELRPAQPALAHLTFSASPGAQVDPVRPFSKVTAQAAGGGGTLIFETEEGLDLVRVPLTDVQVFDGSGFHVVTAANQPGGLQFRPFGFSPTTGSALYLGFTPTNPPAQGRLFPKEMRLRVFLEESILSPDAQSVDALLNPPTPPVQLVWEYRPAKIAERWQSLNRFLDESSGFTREGYIKVEGPGDIALSREGRVADPRYWLRVRLAGGRYPNGRAPALDFVRFNTVPAINLSTVRDEVLGTSDGTPSQSFHLSRRPIQKESIRLSIEPKQQKPEIWNQIEDLLAAGPDDPSYAVNPNTAEIRFGDGKHGRVLPAGATIVVTRYRFGGGAAGNVPAGGISGKPASVSGIESVTNERPAFGGQEEQSLKELKEQAPLQLKSRNRAVTVEDFNYLASQIKGVAKATAIALMHPDFPEVDVPGAITTVVVPDSDDLAPVPSPELLQAIARSLNEYRLITTELFVTGPHYTQVKVEASVAAQPYASFDVVTQDVLSALKFYLDPLARIPKDGHISDATLQAAGTEGWNFGESLHPTSLFSVILGVEGVAWVRDMKISIDGKQRELSRPIGVSRHGLFSSGDHEVIVSPL